MAQGGYARPVADGVGIRFLDLDGRRIAYSVSGTGPPLVAPAWWLSHLELDWVDPVTRSFWEAVSAGHTLVRYDRLGMGMSDRDLLPGDATLERDVAVLAAIVDELGFERVTLFGGSSGSCAAIAFGAHHPERVDRLLLCGAYADGAAIATPDVQESIVALVRSHWGIGSRVLADLFLGESDSAGQERLARYQRAAASPEHAAALLELTYRNDVRDELPRVQAPTLVLHRRGDRAIPYELGRELAAGISGATLIPLDGTAHLPWAGDTGAVVRAIRSVLAPEPSPRRADEPAAALLSGREREILALVANGLSDQEIATQLVLSPHTVHRHVANIRTKLGRTSRSAAVAEAARLGLL